ncbi:MAG: hypothetical protein OZSIB_0155 [Candidatus Ozemobacter sibiricus]|uniref:Uncharacterized protein n=1 Tax=Candidatus Ozemobacter sibiricus TaxID=2268124 RepID=A0A367ZMC9_9BACT|nr:MAG: hypothetical protein OZSIB_0155 [Candidatus Ozemobacter sibiricus]
MAGAPCGHEPSSGAGKTRRLVGGPAPRPYDPGMGRRTSLS